MENTEIMAFDEAMYMGTGSVGSENIELVNIGTKKFDEASNPKEKAQQYIGQKTVTNTVIGYDNSFAMENDLIKNEAVIEDLHDNIFEKRATGKDAQRDLYIVKLWKPVASKDNTYEAKKIVVSCVLSDKTRTAGENIGLNGTLKGVSEFVYGEFNTSTKKFTANV